MPSSTTQTKVRLGPQGRLVIPARIRKLLKVEPGDTLVARFCDGQLLLEKSETIKRRLKARFANLPEEKSLAEELLVERRDEAGKEKSP